MCAYDPKASSGQSTASIDSSVLGMPFLSIVQKGSPEFDKTHRNHATKKIQGCEPGDIIFGMEKLILTQPLSVIPVAQTTIYSEWKDRNAGGGFVGHVGLEAVANPQYRKGAKGSPNQYKEYLGANELIYTIYVMLLFQYKGTWRKGMISFTSTQLKHARNWLKDISSVRFKDLPDVKPPLFAASWLLKAKPDANSKGSWYAWEIQADRVFDLTADETMLTMAEEASVAALHSLPSAGSQDALPAPHDEEEAGRAY